MSHAEFYLFINNMVLSNLLKSSVLSIPFPHDQIISTYKITIFVKEIILVVKLDVDLLEFFQELQSKEQNVS